VNLLGVAGDARIQDENSSVELHLKSAGNVQVDNRNGDITVGVPDKLGFKLDARARGGEVQSDFSEVKINNDDREGSASGTVGNGAVRLVLNSEHGTVTIRRASLAPPTPPEPPALPGGGKVPHPPRPPKVPPHGDAAEPTEN
jgi:DUF4097 and DUF4098 domain-containing protein YvlB